MFYLINGSLNVLLPVIHFFFACCAFIKSTICIFEPILTPNVYVIMRMFDGITEMLIIVIFEIFVVIVAMGCDFSSGYYKAKLRKEARDSFGLRRTVSKFILYEGSMIIACGIDSICYVCKFWMFIHVPALTNIPVVASIVAVFILVTEVRSIWEKADAKQRRQAGKTAEMIGKVINKETLAEVIKETLINTKEKEAKNESLD